jgi:hypothetical protein
MTDFIHIDENVFLKYKKSESDTISTKISTTLSNFNCFNDYSAFISYKSKKFNSQNHSHHHHHHHNHNHNHNHSHGHSNHNVVRQRRKLINDSQTEFDRDITALLNKISKQNYGVITKNILKLITPENTSEIISNILKKCSRQTCFIDIYINILKEVYSHSDMDCKDEIQQQLNKYIDDFITGNEIKKFQLDSVDYNQFCNNMSNKSEIIGKHKTIIALEKKILQNNIIDEYFNSMFNEIIQMDNIYVKDDFERHELLLDIMTDFVKANITYKVILEKYYKTHLETLKSYTSKARFKVLDMITINISL